MGYLRDHAIIVVAQSDTKQMPLAHAAATELFGVRRVSPIMGPFTNNHTSFFIAPDGSKEGWGESDDNDLWREQFIEQLRECFDHLEYVEVSLADEAGPSLILKDSRA